MDGRDTHDGENGVGKARRKLETGDEGPQGLAVSPASETWAPYYASAAKDAAAREVARMRHVDAARTVMRVLVFLGVAVAVLCYRLFADR